MNIHQHLMRKMNKLMTVIHKLKVMMMIIIFCNPPFFWLLGLGDME